MKQKKKCITNSFQIICAVLSRSVVTDSLQSHGLQPVRLLCPRDSLGKNTGVGCHTLFQGMFPTWGSNPGLLHCRPILYHLSHQGKKPLVPLCYIQFNALQMSSFRLQYMAKLQQGYLIVLFSPDFTLQMCKTQNPRIFEDLLCTGAAYRKAYTDREKPSTQFWQIQHCICQI